MKRKQKNIMNTYAIFFVVFFSSALLQSFLFFSSDMFDCNSWSKGAELLATGRYPSPGDLIFGYPGTFVLLPTALFVKFGVDSLLALKITMVSELSLCIACSALLCYKLRKNILWWPYTSIILIANPCYVLSTPPSASIVVLGCVSILMTLYIHEKKEKASIKDFFILGVIGALLLTNRFDFGLAYYFSSIFFLAHINIVYTLLSILTAFGISLAATPFIWESPVSYFVDVFAKITDHASSFAVARGNTFDDYINVFTIYGSLSLMIGILLFFRKNTSQKISKAYIAWLTSFTIIMLTLLLTSAHHPSWFIFPFAISWEALLPLLIFILKDEIILTSRQSTILLRLIMIGHILLYTTEIII